VMVSDAAPFSGEARAKLTIRVRYRTREMRATGAGGACITRPSHPGQGSYNNN
jgi:hypothetical protein